MDFTFSEEQQAAAEAARGVFADVAPDAVPSPALTTGAVADTCDRALWARLADADLLSLLSAQEYGGAGLDAVALCLVLRESAKVLARVPLLEHSAAMAAVQAHGGPELKGQVLERAGRGEVVLTVAASGRTGHDPAELAVTARREEGEDGDWILDGVQTAVPWAYDADFVVVPAHTAAGRAVLALVPRAHDGVALGEQFSTSGERLGELRLDSVRIAAPDVIDVEGAWEGLRDLLTTGTCALALGLGERVLRMSSEYTSKREQFGFPVATFQAVAVQAADRYIDLRAMEVTLWQAAWRLTPGARGTLPVAGDVAVAKIWASDGVRRVVQTAQHLHGGFGADVDYPLHRYHAWAKHLELSLGPAAAHEEALGDLLAAHPLG
ncbi:alkylation response protein AidB-like acyl-CoA dehydrogenase [Streptomyces sp. SAI-135]|uniref:acyl-CoA dehydrogenase family protein n=1 Tax=unclassified Streptomyces TaxID=2593676 RepID=UPI002474CA15|nr:MULTISPECIES: acyl-CoA dehydrogenase family protein [unclassified Streptomyces]MDH6517825.1 alkylation response protein AidB-like acyl-CoA dehydrogenase [Streptomyces sp. SAI-090]MDH6550050.1 alkylation response protein AidB-like acyl-CoA dehydrogenase [Streptomyces sp. SAI-041]MDH6618084.1 alkylation response protein AidB-like acyl-CoA dehydrogenase [Streptomyces sp. SAI-135]